MTSASSSEIWSVKRLRSLIGQIGFPIMLLLLFIFFSAATPGFLSIANLAALAHALAPVAIIASGLAMVVMAGNLDISVGSIAFLSVSIGWSLLGLGLPVPLVALVIVVSGGVLGAVNAFIVVVLRINSLITTLGTMIAFRGLALELSGTNSHTLPDGVRELGNQAIGPIFVDSIIALLVVVAIHVLHQRTAYGRQLAAVGNSALIASKIGLPVGRVIFVAFVISGCLAGLGGIFATLQVGALTAFLGRGLEFNAVAVIVVGGISLFGGAGNVLSGILLGAVTFEMIRNGLNHLDANPYAYRPISGLLIFMAMYADSFRSRGHRRK
ncbi:MAG: ABC transporter permease [Devosia nanyangense]|uniref:Autoinducer 2 import system permease protein LsrD n=1 Tax=Devosia nanyangense TaxID=1228055 RepID=A0A933NZP3_9HYPH|nr:ABC transporter permease [Devosia nanyangense]